MEQRLNPSFDFHNQVAPRYIEPLFLHLQYDRWYTRDQLIGLLHSSGLDVKGEHIVSTNMQAWHLTGLGQIEKRGVNKFRLAELGKQLIDIYSTNQALFYDLIHFFFYSAYQRSCDVKKGAVLAV